MFLKKHYSLVGLGTRCDCLIGLFLTSMNIFSIIMSKFYFRVEAVFVKQNTLYDGNKKLTKFETKYTAN